ncbi:MAG: N-acetylglucosamine-6-phosphate deacetylase [Mangrovicoccus sp.]|nr:N-acetylglucosamine-6-phosphate deacetylase [Mangrovicoccus sp.]
MTPQREIFRGGTIFDGRGLIEGHALLRAAGRLAAILPEAEAAAAAADAAVTDLAGDILCPGYVDLQVNGGGGVMFNDDQSVAALTRIAAAHARLGATTILPTLITDTPQRTAAAIDAVASALADGVPGIGGLHLEGPHLSLARKGAHDPRLIRPMTDRDLSMICEAARRLPALMVTLAPENATRHQVEALAEAGVIVSLGHSDADFATCQSYAEAGASCVTHLFNAMSQMGSREPGLVGAALSHGRLSAGLIADAIHVHPAAMRVALAAKQGPGAVFLVSDAMSPAGTDQTSFTLNGRVIRRSEGRLTLADGTLAGADLDLTAAVNVLVTEVGLDLTTALAMATRLPAEVAGLPAGTGRFAVGASAGPMLRLARAGDRLRLAAVIAA